MRVVIIGGTGHIGSYLTPRLFEAGHHVVCVSRGQKQPYIAHRAWSQIESVFLDRTAEESAGTFGGKIRDLHADALIDLTAYTVESTQQLVDALHGHIRHFLHCGTIWVHGPGIELPVKIGRAHV